MGSSRPIGVLRFKLLEQQKRQLVRGRNYGQDWLWILQSWWLVYLAVTRTPREVCLMMDAWHNWLSGSYGVMSSTTKVCRSNIWFSSKCQLIRLAHWVPYWFQGIGRRGMDSKCLSFVSTAAFSSEIAEVWRKWSLASISSNSSGFPVLAA